MFKEIGKNDITNNTFKLILWTYFMNINYKIGKLGRGLEMAYELQNRILFKNFDLEILLLELSVLFLKK